MNPEYTGQKIAARRKELGLTQKALAEKLHVTDKAVSKWERGVNFPDLSLLESLATALETSPTALLGLEEADSQEVLSSLAEISAQQLSNAKKDLIRIGWMSLPLAVALLYVYELFGSKDASGKQDAYILLSHVIGFVSLSGVALLIKYGEIRKFDVPSVFLSWGCIFPVLFYLLWQLATAQNPPLLLGGAWIAVTAGCAQGLFRRILRPKLAQALPMMASLLLALWGLYLGYCDLAYFIPALVTVPVFLLKR